VLVHRYLEERAAQSPHAVALKTAERTLTFEELNTAAASLATGLRRRGVRTGDRVALYLDNRAETVIAIFGALKAGAAFLMIYPSARDGKVMHLLNHAAASALILPATRLPALAQPLQSSSIKAIVTTGPSQPQNESDSVVAFDDLLRESADAIDCGAVDLDLAALLYTSGSTGEPKGVMLTHANICAAIDSVAAYLELSSRDTLMNVLPLSFGYGLTQLFSAVKTGATFMLERGMPFPPVTLSKMAAEGVTGFAVVPTLAAMLLGLDLSRYDLSKLRYITNAGAALPVAHVRQLRATIPGVKLILMYGQTECLRISYLEPAEVDGRPDSVGRGMPNQEVYLVDAKGCRVAPGQVGELVVRGSHVMRGYWQMPEETARKLRPGRYPGEVVLHTGDLFRQDEGGYLYFVARGDDIIKSRGEKVSPLEVENAIFRMEGVAEAVVFGVDHPLWGQAIKALVVPKEGVQLSSRDVQQHCARHLEDFMVPTEVEIRHDLPRTENGKVHKAAILASAASPRISGGTVTA
jgi:amino acid adenylation domain-containing protein